MASTFVPVDLDKLLDEFEEKEEEPKLDQTSTVKVLAVDRKRVATQSFQSPFPSIQEEVLSDQEPDQYPADSKKDVDDDSDDSSSINGVIQAAEAITNQNVAKKTLRDELEELEESVVSLLVDSTLQENAQDTSESVNTAGHFDLNGVEHTNHHVSSLDDGESLLMTQERSDRASDGQEANSYNFDHVDKQINGDIDESRLHSAVVANGVAEHTQDLEFVGWTEDTSRDNSEQPGDDEASQYGLNEFVVSEQGETLEQSSTTSVLHPQDVGTSAYGSNVTSYDQSQGERLCEPGLSNMPVAGAQFETYSTYFDQTHMTETQDFYAQNENADSGASFQNDPMITNIYNGSEQESFDTGNQFSQVHRDEGTQSPQLTMTLQSQGAVEARRITSGEACLGRVPPIWVPDSVATHCMNCGLKFGVLKRRHHCRACGKALCSSCCNMKFVLPYLDNKEGRVCQVCCSALLRAQALSEVMESQEDDNLRNHFDSVPVDLLTEDVLEEHEDLPADQQEIAECAEALGDEFDSTELPDPGVDAATAPSSSPPVLPPLQIPELPPTDAPSTPLSTPTSPALSDDSDCLFRLDVDNVRSLLPQDITALPPVLRVTNEEISIQERPDPAEIMHQLKGLHETVVFLLNKNLVVKVSLVKLSCCVKRKCWCFVTEGMGAANQEEMVVLLECHRKETMLPKDVLSHFNTAFAYAKQGHTVSELGYTIFGQPFLGSDDNAGFLYVKPSFQCLKNIPVPSTPYVIGVLIKRLEAPWAQLFPLRLQLRLGAEFRYYPCPLFSSRSRSTVYGEVGHTIMNLLADFKNFQYTLPRVTGLLIHMEEKKTLVRLPQDRYDEVVKILNATDEHVMALGANFSLEADSHLVCMQNEQGYKTQAINIQNQARKVTGASFIVFSGALKPSSPFMAKVNIVEDGIMVQLMPEVIGKLRNSLKEMQDYAITTGVPGGAGEEQVIVEWVSRQNTSEQASLHSPIDGLKLDSFPSVKVHSGCNFTRKNVFRIQWTEVFFLVEGQQSASRDLNKLTGELAKAFCQTLMPHLSKMSSDGCTSVGLRVNLDPDNVGYLSGSNQQFLPANIMVDLDNVLVPVIHAAVNQQRRHSLSVELLFKVLRLL